MAAKKKTAKKSSKGRSASGRKETFEVKGEELLAKVKALIKEGNVREITLKNKRGKTLIVVPLTLGVVGVILAPALAAIGTIAALVTECTVTVKRR